MRWKGIELELYISDAVTALLILTYSIVGRRGCLWTLLPQHTICGKT